MVFRRFASKLKGIAFRGKQFVVMGNSRSFHNLLRDFSGEVPEKVELKAKKTGSDTNATDDRRPVKKTWKGHFLRGGVVDPNESLSLIW